MGEAAASYLTGLAANSSISGSSINIADNSRLNIENIKLTSLMINTGSNASLTMENVTLGYADVNSSNIIDPILATDPFTCKLTGIDVGEADVIGSLTLDMNMDTSEFSSLNNALTSGTEVIFNVEGLVNANLTEGLAVNFKINGNIYQAMSMGVVGSGAQFSIVPEPSTSTLSLLFARSQKTTGDLLLWQELMKG